MYSQVHDTVHRYCSGGVEWWPRFSRIAAYADIIGNSLQQARITSNAPQADELE